MPDTGRGAPWGLVGRSAAMEELRDAIRAFGPEDMSVHLQGETGTGKELVARALHQVSGRRGRFVALNAAGFTDELFHAELFGHARGAFTGAVSAREGHVAAARGGTLFLDEVADLTPRGQVNLLRFLESGEYFALGETTLRHSEARVVSAANADIRALAAAGRFRPDLLYRLEEERITLPPLRERGRDVIHLLRFFLAGACRSGTRAPLVSREVEAALVRYPWPGNVRQLRAEARRLVVRATDGVVQPRHLSREVREAAPRATGRLHSARDEWERHHIRRALERHGGNRTATAAELGLSRQALVRKMRRLGIAGEFPRPGAASRARDPATGASARPPRRRGRDRG